MGFKRVLLDDHHQVNKFSLEVVGLPPLTPITISGLEEELDSVDLPDRTSATGGRTKPIEFDMALPAHHVTEQKAMEAWKVENQDPVTATAKKSGILQIESQSSVKSIAFGLDGLWPQKRALPDLDMDNDGDMAVITWTMKCDEMEPI